jgi:hypothetical protein
MRVPVRTSRHTSVGEISELVNMKAMKTYKKHDDDGLTTIPDNLHHIRLNESGVTIAPHITSKLRHTPSVRPVTR